MNTRAKVWMGFVLVVCLALPRVSQAQHVRQGIDLMGGLGLNMCLSSGQAECDSNTTDLGTSFALVLSGGYRFLPIVGAYLDLDYGRLSVDDGSFWSLTVMPTVRGFTTFRQGEVYIGAGVGYSSYHAEIVNVDSSWSNWLNLKLTAGGDYNINRNASVGLNVDWIFNFDESGQVCTDMTGTELCSDDHDADIIDFLQFFVMFKYIIPYQI